MADCPLAKGHRIFANTAPYHEAKQQGHPMTDLTDELLEIPSRPLAVWGKPRRPKSIQSQLFP
jgi:hypothetical protein